MEMKRRDGRKPDELRPVRVERGFLKNALGSCLFSLGETRVLCAVTLDERVPPFLEGTGGGWVTAEYALLPASTNTRVSRSSQQGGRSQEIQRLIGRSLRGIVNLKNLGPRTCYIDCDVLQADGGTRTAAVNGAFFALSDALVRMRERRLVTLPVLSDYLAAISVGVVIGASLLDLDYREDSRASVDCNVVMTGRGKFVEVQGTGEGSPFSREELERLLSLAQKGSSEIVALQKEMLGGDLAGILGN